MTHVSIIVEIGGFAAICALLVVVLRRLRDLHQATNGLIRINQTLARAAGVAEGRLAQLHDSEATKS